MCTNCIFFNWTADIFILPSGRTQPMFLGLSDHLQWRFSRCSHHWTILWTYITWDNPIRFQQASSGVPGWPQCFQRRVCGYLVSGFLRYEVTRKMCSHLIIVWLQFFLILYLFFFFLQDVVGSYMLTWVALSPLITPKTFRQILNVHGPSLLMMAITWKWILQVSSRYLTPADIVRAVTSRWPFERYLCKLYTFINEC